MLVPVSFIFFSALVQLAVAVVLPQPGPGISLPLAKRLNSTGIPHILAHDRARAKSLYNRIVNPEAHAGEKRSTTAESIREETPFTLMIYLYFGADFGATNDLILDTSESLTWIGATQKTVNWNPTGGTGRRQYLSYTWGGTYLGTEYKDTVLLDKQLVADNFAFGVATRTSGIADGAQIDGVFGLGPQSSSAGTFVDYPSATVPNIIELLYQEGKISSSVFSIFMPPHAYIGTAVGQLVVGGIDPKYASAPIVTIPMTNTYPSSSFWGINQAITYGPSRVSIMRQTAGVFDSTTVFTLIPTDALERYTTQIGAQWDNDLEMWYLTNDQYENLQSLYFKAGGTEFEFTANAQILPRYLNKLIGASIDNVYLIIADSGNPTGSGLDFINGVTFIERFYTSYDITNRAVGIAPTQYTYTNPN